MKSVDGGNGAHGIEYKLAQARAMYVQDSIVRYGRERYPVGIQTFSEVREGRYIYVDKTECVYDMTHTLKYVFLSRPRRFGKSLLVSTLKSYFEGRRDLFEGLTIDFLESEWNEYPVLHFDMSTAKHVDRQRLESELSLKLSNYEEIYGRDKKEVGANQRLTGLIKRAYAKTKKKVVVLIDEYDAPLLDVIHEEENLPQLRQVMRNFYSPLKACDPYLRFVFLTGITKFSQLSIFSELNNIADISMNGKYAAICGITQQEMLSQMPEGIDRIARNLEITKNEAVQRIKSMYDGYHFTWPSPDIYNPYSLVNAFLDGNLNSYWFATGTPTFLVNMLQKFDVPPTEIGNIQSDVEGFATSAEQLDDWVPLLYQSGYLTITDYDAGSRLYTLDIPNWEVRSGLFRNLVPAYAGTNSRQTNVIIRQIGKALDDGMVDPAMEGFRKFFSSIPHGTGTNTESNYQQLMVAILFACGIVARIEERTAQGRIDIIFETNGIVYIFELKLDKTAYEALRQIDEKDYASRYDLASCRVIKVGISLSSSTRTLSDWEIG